MKRGRRHALRRLGAGATAAILAACAAVPAVRPQQPQQQQPPLPSSPPPLLQLPPDLPLPPREFRGVWVASVANIDWPSKPGLPAALQRAEAVAILDRTRALNLNAVILQVRPAGDALYPSALEPWSEVLSGEQGRPPEPAYDPLAFWVAEAHRRGLELHAWFNPYRARHSSAKSPLAAQHLALRQPALVKRYGDMLWMDPGEPAAAAHTLAVVADVARRYDIDGVHIDDYFYPYPVADQPFPDDAAWARFQLGGGTLARDDWRRANVDALVQQLHRGIRQAKPWLRFGISPFGIGRPDRRPPGITGFSQYDRLYADVESWLANGWLDYLVPQLYWPNDRAGQQFPLLLDYWLAQNVAQRHVWPGLFTSQVKEGGAAPGPRAWPAAEIAAQVAVQRSRAGTDPAAAGHVHFSMAALMADRDGIATLLRQAAYTQTALTPAMPWLQAPAAAAPQLRRTAGGGVAIATATPAAVTHWLVWRRSAGAWQVAVQPAGEQQIDPRGADAVAAAAIDRAGAVGERSALQLP